MKPLLIAAALLLAPTVAQAQVAAGALPNTFDRPVRATPVPATAPADERSGDTLRTIIAGAQVGALDYALMTDDLAGKVREQEAAITPLIQSFGAVLAVAFIGSQEGADRFGVTFANAATEWVIGFSDEGKVAVLLFRPAE
ncbi:MAG: hypothetical protein Q8R45_12805 [Brevundimonas sp.]|uniref:hypothetical protein n=1 Tax=Brevundimonas sp. TaxID=1871086 RepID=UPI00271AC12B|nr:hypothetical protein [Brevundimonas sp.]MDO9588352.1 hypothetical protein [Brevundimonas sp.]MDP3368454.1 hypothetical protein [Brevundimonas sp.]MDP3657826.1 hypothetical protein [Brevundimonas sp.]MDZ4114334.1 hypothetical protein [Brevundimonas sp.]